MDEMARKDLTFEKLIVEQFALSELRDIWRCRYYGEGYESGRAGKLYGCGDVDGPVYNAGRMEGHADMCAELRHILDPEDKNHWNKDGLLKEVRRLFMKAESTDGFVPFGT